MLMVGKSILTLKNIEASLLMVDTSIFTLENIETSISGRFFNVLGYFLFIFTFKAP